MRHPHTTRRAFLGSTVLAGATLPFAAPAEARPDRTSDYVYEITRTEAGYIRDKAMWEADQDLFYVIE